MRVPRCAGGASSTGICAFALGRGCGSGGFSGSTPGFGAMPSTVVALGTTVLTGGARPDVALVAGGVGTDGSGVVSAAEGGASVGAAETGRAFPGISSGAGNSGANKPVAGARVGLAFGAAVLAGKPGVTSCDLVASPAGTLPTPAGVAPGCAVPVAAGAGSRVASRISASSASRRLASRSSASSLRDSRSTDCSVSQLVSDETSIVRRGADIGPL
jgi:hypothetical protein